MYSLFLDASSLSSVRKQLKKAIPSAQCAHIAEALAKSLGFNTSIGLNQFLNTIPARETRLHYWNAQAFVQRLAELGTTLTPEEHAGFDNLELSDTAAMDFMVVSEGVVDDLPSDPRWPSREEVERCKGVLRHVTTFTKDYTDRSSYGYKHDVEEKNRRYVSNGAFIQAAVELRMPIQVSPHCPNVELRISKQEWERAMSI